MIACSEAKLGDGRQGIKSVPEFLHANKMSKEAIIMMISIK
jgi:hypothetical protein